jgi:hypothetical protein
MVKLSAGNLNAVLNEAVTHDIPVSYTFTDKFPQWYFGALKYCI